MNNFRFNCPYCNASLEVDQQWIGSEVECPRCRHLIPVRRSEDRWAEIEAGYRRTAFIKKMVIFVLLCTLFLVIVFSSLYNHVTAKRRAEEARRIRVAQQIEKEKRLAEERRQAELRCREEEKFIRQEFDRAEKSKEPEEALMIIESLRGSYSGNHPMMPEIRRKHAFFSEAKQIKAEIQRSESISDLRKKISFLENLICRYPSSPRIKEVETRLTELREEEEELRKIDEQIKESRRKIEEANREIADQRNREIRERRTVVRRTYTGTTQYRNSYRPTPCRWCKGTGSRSPLSSRRDCTFCNGSGRKTNAVERLTPQQKCWSCGGSGRFWYNNRSFSCSRCSGSGRIPRYYRRH